MNFINYGVQGADVSFYQDSDYTPQQIDFSKMIEQNASFVIIRAGQNNWIDPDFGYNWQKAKETGLPRGSYWFYDSRISPIYQAELFASLFVSDSPELRLWIDLEETYGGLYSGFANWKKFLLRLQQLLPRARIGIYTSYGYINGKIPLAEYSFFASFSLWLAWWDINNPQDVIIPAPWTSCEFWQWGTPAWGLLWGCESIEIDMNLFNGTKAEFQARFGLNLPGVIMKGTALVTVNIRDINNLIIGKLYRGDVVYGEVKTTFGLQRIFFNKVYRVAGEIQPWQDGSNAAIDDGVTKLIALSDEPEPGTQKPSIFISHSFSDTLTVDGVIYDATFSVNNVEYKPRP